MKIDRLLGILIVLSKKESVTAPYLAQYFEVSRRTINRDIESLCMAGVPIITRQGNNGGISIEKGYKLDKNIFKKQELTQIMSGLKALSSIENNSESDNLIRKIGLDQDEIVKIELGSFYKDSLSSKIEIIKDAIYSSHKIAFTYYNKNGEFKKCVNPYYVIYKWSDWYVYAFDDQFRLFKLNRLWDLKLSDEFFDKIEIPKGSLDKLNDIFMSNYHLKVYIEPSEQYKLVESYGNKCFTKTNDGKLLFERDFTNFNFMLEFVLSFSNKAKVIEPKELIDRIKEIAQDLTTQYEHDI